VQNTNIYVIPLFFRIHGSLDTEAMRRSIQQLVRKHESLRTKFVEQAGYVVQQIAAPEAFSLESIEIGNLPTQDRALREAEIIEAQQGSLNSREISRSELVWCDHPLMSFFY